MGKVINLRREKKKRSINRMSLVRLWVEDRVGESYVQHYRFVDCEPVEYRFWKYEVEFETRYYIIPEAYYVKDGEIYRADNDTRCTLSVKTPPSDELHSCFKPRIIDNTLEEKVRLKEYVNERFREIRHAHLLGRYGDERYHSD